MIRKDGQFNIDFLNLEQKLADPKNKVVIFSNPCNPTGRMFTYEQLKKIGELCIKYEKYIISDEIFADLSFSKHTVMASISPEIAQRTLTVFSASKTFNLSGLICSFAIIKNPEIMKKFVELQFVNDIKAPNTFGQVAI